MSNLMMLYYIYFINILSFLKVPLQVNILTGTIIFLIQDAFVFISLITHMS